MKYLYRIPLIALFLFVLTGIVINHHTTYGQIPTLEPLPSGQPTLQPLPTGLPSLQPVPSGNPTLEPLPSGLPTLQPVPSGIPTLEPIPSGIPTLPPAPGGNSFIFGFVNNADDDALPGVTVTLDGAEYSESSVTDEDGAFEFRNLSAGEYTLTCEKEGFETISQDISLGDSEIYDAGTIVLEEVVKATLSGYVVDINGDPIENVRIKAKGLTTGYKNTAASDADGFFEFTELEEDTYVLVLKKKGYKRKNMTVSVGEGESEEVEITMKKTSKRIIKAVAR